MHIDAKVPLEFTTSAENFDQHVIRALFDCFVSSFNGSDFADAVFHAEYITGIVATFR